ncbi:uncharacterized protein [Diadema antillarum]|uniref:uncharacterized protein n=1 Tax=Diadema antillarum TaxID=105358 RepID=UPI003A873BBD
MARVLLTTSLFLVWAALTQGSYNECPMEMGMYGPTSENIPIITSFISADGQGNGSTFCRLQYGVPENATLWQGMLAASQQHGMNFTFEAQLYAMYGHFVTTINGLMGNSDYFWGLYDEMGAMTPVGVDFLYPVEGSAYIWSFTEVMSSGNHNRTYEGVCLNAPDIQPNMPLTYGVFYLTVSSGNTQNFTNGTRFQPVCKQLVLSNVSQESLLDAVMTASEQVPIKISSDIQNDQVTILNTLPNQDGYVWTPYNATNGGRLPLDLAETRIADGDHIRFQFMPMDSMDDDVTMEMEMTTSSNAPKALVALFTKLFALLPIAVYMGY